MHFFRVLLFVSVVSLTPICAFSNDAPSNLTDTEFLEKFTPPISREMESALVEANRHFTYKGKPIHPDLVGEFIGWVSDGPPITLAVDVSMGTGSNEYFTEVKERDLATGLYYCTTKKHDSGASSVFCYTHRHKTKDDVHYLEAFSYDFDDSRFYQKFDYKLWVNFDIWHGVDGEGGIYEQLVMRIVKTD
ncbi:hypothetical protein [Desulforhopalus sp. 52FAK]